MSVLVSFTLIVVISSSVVFGENKRSVVKDYNKIWRRGDVIYTMSGAFTQDEQTLIKSVMKEIEDDVMFHNQHCIQFHNKAGQYAFETDYIYITKAGTCSYPVVGMPRGRGIFELSSSCMDRITLLHYFMRVLGVFDEHTRPDRDSYIKIKYDNIQDAYRSRFNIVPANVGDTESLPYDFQSITHFGPYAYAKDSRVPTISALIDGVAFGDRSGLSSLDAQKLQILYRCHIDTSHVLKDPAHPVKCDFEEALCNLADDWQDDFTWDRKNGPISSTGPQADHSNGRGYFLYVNSTNLTGGKARLISAREIPPGQYCVELYYYLKGNGNTLNVVMDDYMHHTNKTLRTTTTNTDVSWSHMKFGTVSQVLWRIIFEAVMTNLNGGMAIDDVSVTQGYCI